MLRRGVVSGRCSGGVHLVQSGGAWERGSSGAGAVWKEQVPRCATRQPAVAQRAAARMAARRAWRPGKEPGWPAELEMKTK